MDTTGSVPHPGSDTRFGIWHDEEQMKNSKSLRFPVTVTQLPVVRCQICRRTVAYRPGEASKTLTDHYLREHPESVSTPRPRQHA